MRKSFSAQWLAGVLAASLVVWPVTVAGQSQQSGQVPKPSDQPAQQTQAPPQASAQSPLDEGSLPGTADPKVKPGSEDDVNAIGNRKVGKGPEFYSLEHDIAIGKQLAQEVDKTARFINDPVVVDYVNKVGQNLVRNSDAQVPFTIKVIDSDVVNAFALPGGFFYVNSGIILHADNEAEMAGVMAHEIGHVCARHGTRNESKADIMQLASIPAMIFIPYSLAGLAIYQGMNFAIPLTFLKFSRDSEREADFLGLQYMYKAGYDPNQFVAFFETVEAIEKKQPGTIPAVFDTHPPTPDRVKAAQEEIATILPARGEYIEDTSDFDMVKKRLQMIEANMKVKDSGPDRPTLRNKTDNGKAGNGKDDGTTDDGKPTLKRRPDDGSSQTQ